MTTDAQGAPHVVAWWRFPPLRNALIAGAIAIAGLLLGALDLVSEDVERVLYIAAIPIGGLLWAREGLEELLSERVVGIEILMLAATGGCGALGMWNEAAALVVLFGAAEGLEGLAFTRARSAIRGLLDLAPREARVRRDGRETMIPATELAPGDHFFVRPGESVATDGTIVSGTTSLDEAAITGESIPVDKGPGEQVFAASLNGPGAIEVRASTAFADNTLSKIIHLVEEAQEQKGRAQAWIERFGRRYSPAVLVSAVLLVVVPWVAGMPIEEWARRAVVLLVAAAPCALVISLPIAMAVGIGAGGRRGILIKGGAHLEHLGLIRIVALDKTGTLTLGRPRVTTLTALDGDENRLLGVAAALEGSSEHPLARAVVSAANERSVAIPEVREFRAHTGAGVSGEVAGRNWMLGRPEVFRTRGATTEAIEGVINDLESEGQTVVLLGDEQHVRGVIAFQDTVRPEAPSAIARLHRMGIRTAMLTGDNARAARHVARSVGVDDVRAGLRPEDKVKAVRELGQGGPVLMVGDGVNDAPALAAATCGAAMGAAGTDAAIEAADIALMADDLSKLIEALELGRRARTTSKQNVVFSLLVLLALIPLAVTGLISVAAAVVAHEGSELLAVANGLRVGRGKPG